MAVARGMEDPGVKVAGKGQRQISKGAKLARGARICTQKLRMWWKVDLIMRGI